jgi:tetratricopeptide (TPR) repeat protein
MEEVRQTPLEDVAQEWALDYMVLTEFEYARLIDQLDPARWGLVYWDDFAAVYLRRQSRFEQVLESYGLRHFPPFGGVEGLEALAQDNSLAAALRRELDQILGTEPDSQRALYLLGLLSFYQGDDQQAERLLRQALAIGPNDFVSRALDRVRDPQPVP